MALGGDLERPRGKVTLREPVLVAALIGCALGAVVLGVNAFAAHWEVHCVPKGDLSVIEWNVMRAVQGEQIGGMYSRFGWNHPGPAYFYWLAPFYWLFGPDDGVWVGAAALAALSLALSLQAWRALTASPVLILSWTLPLFGMTFALVTSQLDRFAWTPVPTVFVYFLLISASLAIAREKWRWIGVALVSHALLAQTHVAYLLTATVTLGFGIAWGVAAHRRYERALPRPRAAPAAGTVVMLAVLWWPVALEVARPGPSNLARVFRFFLSDRPLSGSITASTTTTLLVEALSRPVEGLLALLGATPLGNSARGAIVVAVLIVALGALAASVRRHSDLGLLLSAAALLQLALIALGLKGIADQALDYLLFWMSAAAVVPWMAGSYALFERLQMPARSWTGKAAVALITVLAGAAYARASELREPLRGHGNYARAAQRIAGAAHARLPPRARVLIEGYHEQERLTLAVLLRRQGHRPTFSGRNAASAAEFLVHIGEENANGTVLGDWQGQVVVLRTRNSAGGW